MLVSGVRHVADEAWCEEQQLQLVKLVKEGEVLEAEELPVGVGVVVVVGGGQ